MGRRLNGARADICDRRNKPRTPGLMEVLAAAFGAGSTTALASEPAPTPEPTAAATDKATGVDGGDSQEPEASRD